jgi:hypothetical protein
MIELGVLGIGLLAPGLRGWSEGQRVLSGQARFAPAPLTPPAPQMLPAAERRRCAQTVAWALAAAQEATQHAATDARELATVFTSSDGDGAIVHQICSALASDDRRLSPIQFHNSVHNAAAGYWSIGARAEAPSTSLCAYDASFGAGLIEAACQVVVESRRVLLCAVDLPCPAPLDACRPARHGLAAAVVLAPVGTGARARLQIAVEPAADPIVAPDPLPAGMDEFAGNAAAACLPLLAALAGAQRVVRLAAAAGGSIAVTVRT